MEDIKQTIKNYISVDDEIIELNKKVKELRKSKTLLEEHIKEYMITNGIAKVDLGSGALRLSKIKPSKKINKKVVLDVLKEHIDETKADTIVGDIFNETQDPDTEEQVKIERTKKK